MLKEDFVIQSNLRRVLIRTSIDYSRMDFGTVKGVVYIRGIFEISLSSKDGDEEKMKNLTINTLYSLEKKVRSIPGVSDVIFQLLNWRKERGQWVPIEVKKVIGEKKEEEDETKMESDL
jgi:hypothetical protein